METGQEVSVAIQVRVLPRGLWGWQQSEEQQEILDRLGSWRRRDLLRDRMWVRERKNEGG